MKKMHKAVMAGQHEFRSATIVTCTKQPPALILNAPAGSPTEPTQRWKTRSRFRPDEDEGATAFSNRNRRRARRTPVCLPFRPDRSPLRYCPSLCPCLRDGLDQDERGWERSGRLWPQERTTKLRPQSIAIRCPKARRSRFAIKDHGRTDIVAEHGGIGHKLDGHSQVARYGPGLGFIGEVDDANNFGISAPARQDRRRDRVLHGKEHFCSVPGKPAP